MQKVLFAACFLALTVGCSTDSTRKDYEYMMKPEYQKRPVMDQSLLSGLDNLSEEAIHKILESRVVFPKSMTIAVVRLDESGEGIPTVDKDLVEQFYKSDAWKSPRIRSILPVPQALLARPVTLKSLRQAAVILQADAMLIVRPQQRNGLQYNLTEKNRAKSTTSLEIMLLDTRTSIVPYTSIITATEEIAKLETDYNNQELLRRASDASEKKAFLEIPQAVGEFVTKAM